MVKLRYGLIMLLSFAPVVLFRKCQSDYLAQNNVLIKRDSSCRKIYEVLAARHVQAARMRELITARMLANACKDHLIPLTVIFPISVSRRYFQHLRVSLTFSSFSL